MMFNLVDRSQEWFSELSKEAQACSQYNNDPSYCAQLTSHDCLTSFFFDQLQFFSTIYTQCNMIVNRDSILTMN